MTEIRLQDEKHFLICIYCSPSQSHDEFDDFCSKFDLLLSKINHNLFYVQLSQEILMVIAQDGGRMILIQQVKKSTLTLSAGCKQIIDKPTHVINNSMH